MTWSVDDVKRLKEKTRYRQIEKVVYRPLARWIKGKKNPRSKVYVDPSALGIDIIEVNEHHELVGYEVKMARLKRTRASPYYLDITPISQGVGQAINYFNRGMDYAYLVAPQIEELEYLPSVLRKEAPSLGLILFDKDLSFKEALKAKKALHYTPKTRKLILEILSWHRPY